MKRFGILLMALLLTLTAMPAYAGTLTPEPVTLTWFFPINASWQKLVNDLNDTLFFKTMEEKTGVHIEWWHPPLGQEAEQFNLMISSGDLPDIITTDDSIYTYPGGADKAVEDGFYLALNDKLAEFAPNYNALISSTADFARESRTDSGTVWGFSMVESTRQGAWTGMVVRQDWLDQLGMETPVTFDDWHEMLTRFKNELGADAPLMLPTGVIPPDDSIISGFGVGHSFYKVDNVVKYGPIESGYRDFVTTMNQWYAEGLIDSEFNTRTDNTAVIYNNRAGVWFDGFYMLAQHAKMADSDTFHLVGISTPVRAQGETAHLRQSNNYVRGYTTAITSACENVELAMRYLDSFYSEEGYMLSNYGVEGTTYNLVDGQPVFTDLIVNNPDGLNINDAIHLYCLHHGPMNRVWNRDAVGYTEDENACEGIWGQADDSYVMPAVTMTADEGARYATIMGDITTFVNEKVARFVMGLDSMDTYDAFVSQIKSMNIDEAISIQQAALDRYNQR